MRRVAAVLETSTSDETTQHGLVEPLRGMVADGTHPQVAQQIVGELVAQSQDEVRRLIWDAFSPLQQRAEEPLKSQQSAVLQELEAIETEAAALFNTCGGSNEEAVRLGFDPHLAERSRLDLHMEPVAAGASMVLVAPNEGGQMTRLDLRLSTASSSIDQESCAQLDPVSG